MRWFRREKELEDLIERVERLEHSMKQLQIEWTDTYDKFRRLHMRVAKQAQRAEHEPEVGVEAAADGDGAPTAGLTPRQRQITEQIMRRRNRAPGG